MILSSVRLLCASLLCGALLLAQDFRASITGQITDPSGAGVAGAKVTVENLQTNEQSVQTTSGDGNYTVSYLVPGSYKITVEAPGFQTTVRPLVELHTNDKLTANLTLQVGKTQTTVEVTAAPPILDNATASRGDTIENLRVTQLPLNGRNPFTLTNLATGVVFAGNPQFTRPFDNGDNINFSINGGLRQTNSWLLDGIPDDSVTDTDTQRTHGNQNIAYIPTVDATQEFKVVTNFYDAQYGRTGGGVMNVTTKSGTNDFHGTGYEFLRRYQLDANSIQNNAAGRPRYGVDPTTGANLGGHSLDQYGTQVTGPVWIPKVYKGKDKTFFSFGWENYVETTPSPILTSVPSAAMRNGDFSKTGLSIYDPFSTAPNPNPSPNNSYIRTPFPGNVIPSNRFSPTGFAIINAYPAPNTGSPNAVTNNFIASPNISSDHFRNWIGRVDQNFGEKERAFFRYSHNRRNQIDNGANGFTGPGRDAQDPLVRINDNAVADFLTVVSPSTLIDLRFGFARFIQAAYRTTVNNFDDTTLGFSQNFSANQRFIDLPPRIGDQSSNGNGSSGTYPLFGTRNPNSNITNLLSFEPNISYVHGRQSIRLGADLRDIRTNVSGGSFLWGAGFFNFTPAFTQANPETPSSSSGSSMASLLLGVPANGILQYTPQLAFRWGYYGMYLQDDIKVTQKLTLNIGIRYDIEGSPDERYNRQNRGWNYALPNSLSPLVANANPANCPACGSLTGGLLFAGVNGKPRGAYNIRYGDIQPRIGAAYSLTPLTVIRGGFGIFYLPEAEYGGALGFAADTNYVATLPGGGINNFIPTTNFATGNPFPVSTSPSTNGLVLPTGAALGFNTALGNNVIFSNPNHDIPHVYQYSVGVERQLPFETKLDVEYVGSRSYHINTNDNQAGPARDINANSAAQYAIAQQNPSYFNQSVPNPFAGLIPNNPSLNGATISRQQLLKPYPQFGTVQYAFESVGKLWYDSLQVSATKRYSEHLVLALAYTFSKNLDGTTFINPQDPRPTKQLASSDRPNRLVLSGVYQLPFGKGRKFLGNVNRGWEQLVGGWEYNFIGTLQSGTPLGYPSNVNLIANPTVPTQSNALYFNDCVMQSNGSSIAPNASRTAFVPCNNPAWQVRSQFSLQGIPTYSSVLRNPWRAQWDMSLNKTFNFTERLNAQFRLEAFNIFNTPILGGPNTSTSSLNFGLVTPNQVNFPRNVQLGFKLNF
ncbi:MAG: carboxypeptidase regulatory-like domain-containing protein [Acidobacteriaceae bacterium]|nr:carboxypeptidase regulatory-like domain-containing protein [Acidobacteriaceae bacterium]